MSEQARLAPVSRPGTPADRARSLARSYFRLEPKAVRQELNDGGESMLQLADLLRTEGIHPAERPAIDEVLQQHDQRFRALHASLLAGLESDDAATLRRALIKVSISDTELTDRLQDLLAAQEEELRQEESPVPSSAPPGSPEPRQPHGADEPVARLESTDDGGLCLTVGVGADGVMPSLDDLAEALQLDPRELAELQRLAGPIAGMLSPDRLMADMERQWRRDQDRRPLSLRTSLRAALRAQPAHWLEAILERVGLPPRRRKPERVQDLLGLFESPGGLASLVTALPGTARSALRFILGEVGGVGRSALTRRYGSDADDGWFWLDDSPTSVLGQLRLHSLVFVGSATDKGRKVVVAVVPPTLRAPLSELLEPTAESD